MKIPLHNRLPNIQIITSKQILHFFIVSFFVFCANSFALSKKWEEFHSKNSVKMFFEPKSVEGKSIKKVIVMINFNKPQIASDGKKVKSIRMIQNYDCTTSRFRLRSAINYSNEMLKGAEVSRGNEVTPWRRVPKSTPYGKLMNKICN